MNSQISPKAALLLSTITITAIDGDLDENEVAIINRLDGMTTSSEWDTAIQVWSETTADDCIALIARSLNQKQQRVVMANLIDIAMADGRLDEAENILLRAYAHAFEVSEDDIENMVDVITLKNDMSLF